MKRVFLSFLLLLTSCSYRSDEQAQTPSNDSTQVENNDNPDNSSTCEVIFETGGTDPAIRLPCRYEVAQLPPPAFFHNINYGYIKAVGFARVRSPENYHYSVIIYQGGEWGASLERNEPYTSDWQIITHNNDTGYVYESTDLGLVPVIHVSVDMARFYYVFYWDDVEAGAAHSTVTPHFLGFVESTEPFIKE